MAENRIDPGMNRWLVSAIGPGFALYSMLIIFDADFAIFFMQHWGILKIVGIDSSIQVRFTGIDIFFNR
jgi:hypothetical protein